MAETMDDKLPEAALPAGEAEGDPAAEAGAAAEALARTAPADVEPAPALELAAPALEAAPAAGEAAEDGSGEDGSGEDGAEPAAAPEGEAAAEAAAEPESMAALLAAAELSAEEAAEAAGERPTRDAAGSAEEARKAARRGRPRLKLEELVVGADMRGKVVGVAEFGAFVDIGATTDGLVHVTELGARRVRKVEDVLKQGDSVSVWVKEVDLEGGRVALSMRPRNLKAVDSLSPGETLTGTVTSLTPYGAFVDIGAETEGLVHVSELSHKRVGKPEDVVQVGDTVTVWVKEADAGAGRISLSMRSRDLAPIDTLKPGDRFEGTVTSLTKYGAFVDIGAETDGLVHVSELADHRVNKPEDVVRAGDTVSVWVKEVDVPGRRVSLSMRNRPTHPLSSLQAGEVLEGTVSKVMEYGIFVNVGSDTEGLVHVSEMGSGFVKNPKELVRVGDGVEVRVKEVDLGRKRISLSMVGLRNDLGGELPEAAEPAEDLEYEPEPEERQPTVVELALRRALGQEDAESQKSSQEKGRQKRQADLTDVYSRMLQEYRQAKDEG